MCPGDFITLHNSEQKYSHEDYFIFINSTWGYPHDNLSTAIVYI